MPTSMPASPSSAEHDMAVQGPVAPQQDGAASWFARDRAFGLATRLWLNRLRLCRRESWWQVVDMLERLPSVGGRRCDGT
jgi:hypothetical protein